MVSPRQFDKKYLSIYHAFYDCWKKTHDREVRDMFAYTMGRLKELCVAGVSQKALALAKRQGWALPRSKPYQNPFTGTLICEHNLPKKGITDEILELCKWNDTAVLNILAQCRCYWITSEEDKKLRQNHWHTTRPKDAYTQLQIVIKSQW